jgi:hypothetical protein
VFDAQFEDLEETLNASVEHFDKVYLGESLRRDRHFIMRFLSCQKEEDARALSQIEAHDVETAEQKSDLIAVQVHACSVDA